MNKRQQICKKLVKNAQAVSPLIATLMLVLITVAAAGAFYVWQTGWQSQQTSGIDTTKIIQQSKLTIGGSTTVYPFSLEAASRFEAKNPLYYVDVQQGGSDAGVKSVGTGLVDIGAASRVLTQNELSIYPDLNGDGLKDAGSQDLIQTKIGYGAVTLIISTKLTDYALISAHYFTKAEIQAIYYANSNPKPTLPANVLTNITALNASGATAIITWKDVVPASTNTNKIKIYDRTDASGTEETFSKSMMGTGQGVQLETLGITANHYVGNAGVVAAVAADTTAGLGFCDYGYAKPTTSGVHMLLFGLSTDPSKITNPYDTGFEGAIKTFETVTPSYAGARGLYYITIGAPTGLAKLYIDFVRQPENNQAICTASGCITFY